MILQLFKRKTIETNETFKFTNEVILEYMAKKKRNQAEILLHFVRDNPNLDWNEHGEVRINGNAIPHSNIVDIIHDFTRDGNSMPAIGAQPFARALRRENVPRVSIGNKNRWRLINEDHYKPTDTNHSYSTPLSARRSQPPDFSTPKIRKATRKPSKHWTESG